MGLANRRRFVTGLVLLALLASAGKHVAAEPLEGPRATDRQVTRVVMSLMEREHLSKHPLDDAISQRIVELFVQQFDPMKLYFDKSDIEEFAKYNDRLDDMLKKRDTSFAYLVFNRFLERVDERVKVVDQLLAKPFDFTVDEEFVTDSEAVDYAQDAAEAQERWRRRLKYDLLVLKGDDVDAEEAKKRLTRRYHDFQKRMHQTNDDELLERYLTSVTSSFDPHTSYFSPSSFEDFRIRLGLNYQGIGAELEQQDGAAIIRRVMPGGAAAKAGELKAKDRIVQVGQGEEGDVVDVEDMRLDDIIHLIRGKEGTVVRLGVIPDGETKIRIYKITRARIELKDSEAKGTVLEYPEEEADKALKVGVINLPSFYMDMEGARAGTDYKSTTRDVGRILERFTDESVDAVVLDLRRNGGGSLTEAINLTGLFIDEGPVVQVKDPDGRVQQYKDLQPGLTWEGPLVVLTSKFSASASEIFAGAIQDYRRGLIVGDQSTHGKGTVQSLLEVGRQVFQIDNPPNLGALKITMQQFYRPNGDSTQNRGVVPDVELPSLTNEIAQGEADLDFAVAFDHIPPARFTGYKMMDEAIVKALRENSASRREKSDDFSKLLQEISEYKEQKNRKRVPLHEEKFFALQSKLAAEKKEESQFRELAEQEDEVIKKDFYFDEVLSITSDYLRLLDKNHTASATASTESKQAGG